MQKLLLVILLVLSLSGCSGKYEGWKEIELQDYGSIKVPDGWTCHIQDNEIYMITWDDTVSYDDLEKIAKSFDRNLPEEIEKEKRK